MAVFGLGLSAWLFAAVLTEFAERVRLFRIPLADSLRRAIHLPRSAYGMTFAHLGLAVSVAGFAASAFDQEAIEILKPGGSITLAGYELTLEHVDRLPGPNYIADDATIRVTRDGSLVTVMHPERRFFPLQKQTTGETVDPHQPAGDLYVALGDSDTKGDWTVRVLLEAAGAVDLAGRGHHGIRRHGQPERPALARRRRLEGAAAGAAGRAGGG